MFGPHYSTHYSSVMRRKFAIELCAMCFIKSCQMLMMRGWMGPVGDVEICNVPHSVNDVRAVLRKYGFG